MHDRLQIHSIDFKNYKAYRQYRVTLDAFNVLVGPNNAGKSTIIGSLRILSEGIKRARSRASDRVDGPDGSEVQGYFIKLEKLPVSTENVFHNYDDSEPATVEFHLSNGNSLTLFFQTTGQCVMVPNAPRTIRTPTEFKREFNLEVAFVPVLGPVEHNETLHEKDTARNALMSHSASRNFRNIWYHYPDGFEEFRKTVKATWPGMDIQPPELTMRDSKAILCMFCPEHRIPREIFWAGFGFQVWCQMLTFIVQARKASLLIVDEPDIYLHADLQRQLVGILRNIGPDVVVATHSLEMIMEVESHALLHINKKFPEARRIENSGELQHLHSVLGNHLNATLAQLVKTRRVVFFEGENHQLIWKLARVLGKDVVANRSDFALIRVSGMTPGEVRKLAERLETTIGVSLVKVAIFDCKRRTSFEREALLLELRQFCWYAEIQPGVELENLVIAPDALDRAIEARLKEVCRNAATPAQWSGGSAALLDRLSENLKAQTRAAYASGRAELALDEDQEFETLWASVPQRLRIVSGRDILAALNEHLHREYAVSLSTVAIAQHFSREEVWPETVELIEKLHAACMEEPS